MAKESEQKAKNFDFLSLNPFKFINKTIDRKNHNIVSNKTKKYIVWRIAQFKNSKQ